MLHLLTPGRDVQERGAPPAAKRGDGDAVRDCRWFPLAIISALGVVLVLGRVAGPAFAQDEEADGPGKGEPIPVYWNEPMTSGLAVSPDGRWVAVTDDAGRLTVWDLQQPGGMVEGRVLTSDLLGTWAPVCFATTSDQLWTGANEGGARSWRREGERWVEGPSVQPEMYVTDMAVSPGGGLLALAGGTEIALVDLDTLTAKAQKDVGAEAEGASPAGEDVPLWFGRVAFAGDDLLVLGGSDGQAHVMAVEPLREVRAVQAFAPDNEGAGILTGLAIAPDGRSAAVAPATGGEVRRVWLRDERPVEILASAGLFGFTDLAWSPTADRLAGVGWPEGDEDALLLWSAQPVQLERRLGGQAGRIAFHPTEPQLLHSEDGSVEVLDADSGETLRSLTSGCEIVVLNDTDEACTVYVKGPYSDTLRLEPGERTRLDAAEPGDYIFHAVAAQGGGTYRFEESVGPAGLVIHYQDPW